jgi:hypothetical protein
VENLLLNCGEPWKACFYKQLLGFGLARLKKTSEYCVLMLKKRLGGKSHCDEGWNGMSSDMSWWYASNSSGKIQRPSKSSRFFLLTVLLWDILCPIFGGFCRSLGVTRVASSITGYAQLNLQLLMPIL